MDSILYKFRFVIFGSIFVASFILVLLLLPTPKGSHVQAADVNDTYSSDLLGSSMAYSPNAITRGMGAALKTFDQATRSAERTINLRVSAVAHNGEQASKVAANGTKSILHGATTGATFVFNGVHAGTVFAARSIQTGAVSAVRSVSSGVVFVARVPQNTLNSLTHTAAVSAVIKPEDKAATPTINTDYPLVASANQAAQTQEPVAVKHVPQAKPDAAVAWPIHGAITTLFGVTGWPYSSPHAGIDISDGNVPGATPVHPFKQGRVKEVIHSTVSLGNHIVVDHGGGMTSAYGHLASTSVQVGQAVDKNTVLGLEGSTGFSTGTHLHFEIRLNGTPVNPQLYIHGLP